MKSPFLFIHFCNLGDADSVAAAIKTSGEEDTDDFSGQARADDAAAHGQDVGVIVAAAVFCREAVVAESGPDAVDFVGSNADADTCAADEDAPVESAVSDGFSDFLGNVRIIAAFARQGAVIGELMFSFRSNPP